MNTMYKSQKATNMICEELGVENFYSINFTISGVTLQGRYNPDVVRNLEGFEMSIDRNGFLTFHKSEAGYMICVAFTN